MNIRNVLLAILLVLQVVLIGYVYRPGDKDVQESIRFVACTPSEVTGVILSDGQGKSLTLKQEDGNWAVQPPQNYPADTDRLKAMLDKLTELKSSQLVSRTKGSQPRLKVAEENYNRKIELLDAKGNSHILYVGTDQGGSGAHVRRADMDEVYFAPVSSWEFATTAPSWWRALLVDIDGEALTGLHLQGANSLDLQKNEEGIWTGQDGQPLDQEKVKDLVDTARTISINEYLGTDTKDKLDQPVLTLQLTNKDGGVVSVLFGPKREDGDHLARRDKEAHLVVINSANIDTLFTTAMESLVAKEKKSE